MAELNFSTMPRRLVVPPEMQAREAARSRPEVTVVKDVGKAAGGRGCVFSTGKPDRMNDTIDPTGWRLEAFRRNPILLYAHDHRSEPIGRIPDVRIQGDALVGTLEPPPPGLSPLADRIFSLWDAGFLNATSVGFRPLRFAVNQQRGGTDYLEQELLEVSIVPIPANAEALGAGRDYGAAVRRWIGGAGAPASRWADGLVLELADDDADVEPVLLVDGRPLSRDALGQLVTERLLARGRGVAAEALETAIARRARSRR